MRDPLANRDANMMGPEIECQDRGLAHCGLPGLCPSKVGSNPSCSQDIPDDVLNTAQPFAFDYLPVDQRDPDASTKFNTLLRELTEDEDGRAYLLRWIAHMLQYPMVKPQIMPTFKSHGGTGKDTLTLTISKMLGLFFAIP